MTRKIRKKRNPVAFSPDNLRRWAILHFPEMVPVVLGFFGAFDLKDFPHEFLDVYRKANDYFKIKTNAISPMHIAAPWNLSLINVGFIFYSSRITLIDLLNQFINDDPLNVINHFRSLMKFFIHVYVLIWNLPISESKRKLLWKTYMGDWEHLEKLRIFMLFRNFGDFKLQSLSLSKAKSGRFDLVREWHFMDESSKKIYALEFLNANI